MVIPHRKLSIDINRPNHYTVDFIAHVGDKNTRYIDITFNADGEPIELEQGCAATVTYVSDGVLIEQAAECDVDGSTVIVGIDTGKVENLRSGILEIQPKIVDGSGNIIVSQIPVLVRISPDIAEHGQIKDDSLGTYAEVVREIAAARGTYANLKERLDHTGVTVDSGFSQTSKNPVQNKVVTAKFNEVDSKIAAIPTVTVDSGFSQTSKNPVQNKVIAEEVGDLKSALNGTVDLIGDTTIYNVSLAESGTGVGPNWNLYYDISLPKGTKLNFYLSAYTGVLFTNVLVRFYDTTNTLRSLAPSVTQTGKLQTYTLFEDCTRIWVQINRSATENGVSAQFIMSFDTSGLSADVAKIRSVLPINSEEVLRSDILKYPNLRFKNDNSGGTETAGSDGWVVSDYIPVGLGLTVTGFSYSPTRPGIVEYSFAKTPIGTVTTGSSSKYVTKTYTPPSQVGYVRIQTITSIGNDTNAVSVINSTPKIFHVEKDGSGDFTKLSDAINEAVRYTDSVVYVGAGTWNIIDELGSEYVESVSTTQRGLYLKNRVRVICSSNSLITCNYTGSRADTISWLSAFNAGPLGFTLENATIESSNCRYAIHDERDQDADEYNNYYINCKIKHDNTDGGYNQCIGGGLGLNGHVIIDGCIFENPARTNYQIVYYHNSAGSGKSFVEVKGSYFKGTNTLGFQWYGSSPATQKSTLFAHGNSLGSAIQHTGASGATVENTEVISFNNEIRPLQV